MSTSGNLVFQFTTGTSTGNLTLGNMTADSPAQYFRDFSDVFGTGSGNKFYYCIRHRTADEWEVGIGYMSDATTLVRDSVIESSNSNSLVNFTAGIKDVISDIPASIQNSAVLGGSSSTDNGVARYDGTTGKLIQNSNVTIDDSDNMIIPEQLVVGTDSVGLTDAQLFVGVESDKDKGVVVRMIGGSGEAAFEIQDENELPKAKFSTSGNGALVLNYSGTIAPATYPGFVLSVQNIGDAGEGSWIEILNSGGSNTGAFFGMAGDQFQLFNWQGGDIEFWTHPSASDGRARFIMDKDGNFGIEGSNAFSWSHGWAGGKGILALGNAKTVPSSTLTNAVALYAESGLLQAMDADGTKTRLGTRVVTLTDGATPALNAALGNVFSLTAAGDRTIAVPTNPRAGQRITIRHTASGANRTLALNTGTGGFRFGTTITGLTITTSGLTDYIDCIYNATANKWDVVSYVKGY